MARRPKSPDLFDFVQYKHLVVLSSLDRESAKKMLYRITGNYQNFEKITIINFVKEKHLTTETNGKSMMIEAGSKHFSLFGNFQTHFSDVLNEIPCQILINTDSSSSIYLHAIAASFNKALRLGMHDDVAPDLYDVRLYSKKEVDPESYINHCKTYLHALCGGHSTSKLSTL